MIRSLWIARTGMDAQQLQLDVISNNLANVSTNGFKASRAVFADLLYQTQNQPGGQTTQQTQYPSGLQVGTGVQPVATEHMLTQGSLQQTSNPTDMAIQGSGYFQISMPDGTVGYTRDGSFQVNYQGQLVNALGYPLLPPVTIPANALSVTVGLDGTVSITQPGSSNSVQIGTIQLATFIDPGGLQSNGGNLYTETSSSGPASTNTPGLNGAGTLNQGYVETSNVNVAEELVNMIETQRAYEMDSKAITASDQMMQALTQIS